MELTIYLTSTLRTHLIYMELTLKRIAKKKAYTIGKLYISEQTKGDNPDSGKPPVGGLPFCDTLEPTWRDYAGGARKVNGCSAIPEGRYAVVITWSPKFNEWLPLLLGDAEFRRCWSGIRIHAGNTPADTAGCILVGENKAVGKVYNSRIWLHRLKKLIVEAKDRGEPVWMTVR